MFREDFDPPRRQIIICNCFDIGVMSTEWKPNEFFLKLIEISPRFQRLGIGTAIIRDLLEEACRKQLPMSLCVLKTNPARRLYERLGFRVVGETETHFLMRTGD